MIVGRSAECARIESLLAAARSGSAGVLIVVGDTGIGKTELLRYAVAQATGMRILRATGTQSEAELSFIGLADLLRPALDELSLIPAPQAASLAGVLQLASPSGVDPFASYLATFNLLAALAEQTPVLLVVDDVQWLDAATLGVLAFVCRRLSAEAIAVVMSARESHGSVPPALGDLPTAILSGLDSTSAERVISQADGLGVAPEVRRRLAIASHGNPLALLEIPSVLTQAQRAGLAPLPDPLPVGPSIRRAYGQRLDPLPAVTRTALLVAALSDSGHVGEIGRALQPLAIDVEALDDAESAGLVRIVDEHVEFAHPLVRATVQASSGGRERRDVHRLLAQALSSAADDDRRTWHYAAAAVGPDESVADGLEQAALAARGRGGLVGAATAYERAAHLSPATADRLRRLLEAAGDWVYAGEPTRAEALLAETDGLEPAANDRTKIVQLQASIASYTGRTDHAFRLLTAEADLAEASDPGRAAVLLARAVLHVLVDGDVARAAQTATRAQALAGQADVVVAAQVDALVLYTFVLSGQGAEIAPQLAAYADLLPDSEALLQARLAACALGAALIWTGQFDAANGVLSRLVKAARDHGAPAILAYPLVLTSDLHRRSGQWAAASAEAHEAATLARQLRQPGDLLPSLVSLASLEAAQGLEGECRTHAHEALALAGDQGFRSMVTVAHHALGLLSLGLGRPSEAVPDLERAAQLAVAGGLEEPAVVSWAPDLIESYVRCGRLDDAHSTLAAFERQVERSRQPAAEASVARSHGLLAGDGYEEWFARAIGLHELSGMPFELARTQLCLGERLRRERRRVDARVPLRTALATFEQLGSRPWADRAVVELRATGASINVRGDSPDGALTPQEMQVSLAVAGGASSREAAAALFLSPRTVEYHLGNVYRKLGVRSRSELVGLVVTGRGPFASVRPETLA